MRLSLHAPALTLLVAFALAGSGAATHCDTWATHSADLDTCIIADTDEITPACVYVAYDPCQPTCGPALWIYEESNGIPGLQRGDEVVDDTCHGMIESDTIVF